MSSVSVVFERYRIRTCWKSWFDTDLRYKTRVGSSWRGLPYIYIYIYIYLFIYFIYRLSRGHGNHEVETSSQGSGPAQCGTSSTGLSPERRKSMSHFRRSPLPESESLARRFVLSQGLSVVVSFKLSSFRFPFLFHWPKA